LLDGKEIGKLDLFNAAVTPTPHKLGARILSAGEHTLRLEGTGKNKDSKGFFLGLDSLTVRVPAYSRPPGFDLRTIQVKN
jgi:hypothetical protein